MYADFVPFFAVREGDRAVIAAPAGDGRTGFVSRDDLADVAAAVLLDDSPALDGQALDVTGPEALTMSRGGGGAHRGHRRAGRVPRPDRRGGVGHAPALGAPGLGDRGLGDQLPGDRRR